jgi:Mg2+ and Co2+ transporter CorA
MWAVMLFTTLGMLWFFKRKKWFWKQEWEESR